MMSGVQIHLVNGPISPESRLIGSAGQSSPEIGNEAIGVIDRLATRRKRPVQEDGNRAKEGLDIIGNFAKKVPDDMGNASFATEPGEGSLQFHTPLPLVPKQPAGTFWAHDPLKPL
ncbi:MAG TPA: hypothetical protein VL970_06885, partial [Candidatus Acidoferrales bacterium]|nr:hypothetical protein [Candidatus Acidoferrales bacterium]